MCGIVTGMSEGEIAEAVSVKVVLYSADRQEAYLMAAIAMSAGFEVCRANSVSDVIPLGLIHKPRAFVLGLDRSTPTWRTVIDEIGRRDELVGTALVLVGDEGRFAGRPCVPRPLDWARLGRRLDRVAKHRDRSLHGQVRDLFKANPARRTVKRPTTRPRGEAPAVPDAASPAR